jgi:hypothetical protein
MQRPGNHILLVFVLLIFYSTSVHAQVDQSTLARQILSRDVAERSAAVEMAHALEPQTIGAQLRSALITALEREARLHRQRYEADLRGQPLPPIENPRLAATLAQIVVDLRDPRAIPALVEALGHDLSIPRALASFGEQAATHVAAAVNSPESPDFLVDHGLIALRFMVERSGERPLPDSVLEGIRRVAEYRLEEPGRELESGVTLGRAIDLAVALNDPDLINIVEALASNPAEVIARGVVDFEDIERTQRRAADRLAGVPARPRWR